MKNLFKTLVIIMMCQFAFAGASTVMAQDKKAKKDNVQTMKCWVSMSCENCKAKVEKNIPYEKGVKGLDVDLPTKIVTIKYRPDKTSPAKLEKAIQKLGYKTEIIKEEEVKK
ncbi:MAG: heavy-metal-associated domain-containing protein [Bacteroidota bacterium]